MKIIKQNMLGDESGAIAIITVVVLFFVLIGVAALAIDIGRLSTAKNEIQNAADAGALAGAGILFKQDPITHAFEYNNFNQVRQEAKKVAELNFSIGKNVEIDIDDVEIGHWSFGHGDSKKGFYPLTTAALNSLIEPSEVFNYIVNLKSNKKHYIILDEMDGVIQSVFFANAVRVKIGTENKSFIVSNLFRNDDSSLSVNAVGYIGPSGGWNPGELDYPIAICEESLLEPDICHIGRMLEDNVDGDTAKWTNFGTCGSKPPVSTDSLKDILDVCGEGNPTFISQGTPLAVTVGVVDAIIDHNVHSSISGCWRDEFTKEPGNDLNTCPGSSKQTPTQPWSMTLPVVRCSDGSNCNTITSAINVDVLWIAEKEDEDDEAPCKMKKDDGSYWLYSSDNSTVCSKLKEMVSESLTRADAINFLQSQKDTPWENISSTRWSPGSQPYTQAMARWDCFVNAFKLEDPSGNAAPLAKKTIYFALNCETLDLGLPGPAGDFYGVLSDKAVLVE